MIYSIKRITDPEFASPQLGQFAAIIGAEKTADHKVVLTTGGPYPVLLAQPVKLSVVPEHVAAKGDAAAVPMEFATSPVFDQRIVQAIQQMLNEAGFNVEIGMTDMATYLKKAQNADPEQRPQINFGRWSCACQDVDGVEYPLLHSSSNWSRVSDQKRDALLASARTTVDSDQRRADYAQVAEIVKDNTYILPLYQATTLYGAADVLEWQPTANESMFINRMSWSE